MPIYEFLCPECGMRFDRLVKSGTVVEPCPRCKTESNKQVSAPNFVLEGDGWYKSRPKAPDPD